MSDFCISGIPTGKLNAMVKKMMAQMGTDDPIETVRRFNAGGWVVAKNQDSLFEFLGTVTVPPLLTEFVAKENFKLTKDGGICSYIGDNFTHWFLSGDGKIEDPISEQALRYHKLRKSSVDGSIIAELGGEAKAETTLSEMFSLMEKQKNGEDGVLLNNGWVNIFHVRDTTGVLRAVFVGWRGVGWGVSAYSVENPGRWDDSIQVFARN